MSHSRDEKPQFLINVDIWGLLYLAPFTDTGQVWYARVYPPFTLGGTSEGRDENGKMDVWCEVAR